MANCWYFPDGVPAQTMRDPSLGSKDLAAAAAAALLLLLQKGNNTLGTGFYLRGDSGWIFDADLTTCLCSRRSRETFYRGRTAGNDLCKMHWLARGESVHGRRKRDEIKEKQSKNSASILYDTLHNLSFLNVRHSFFSLWATRTHIHNSRQGGDGKMTKGTMHLHHDEQK